MSAGKGKIARLPHTLREQVNQRLLNGESAPVILAWLNPLPEALKTWNTYFQGKPATEQNLSEWRQAGYQRWLADREAIERTKALADYAAKQAAAGNKLSSGLQAILAGHMLEGFEVLIHTGAGDCEKPDDPVKRIAALGSVVTAMRNADTAADRVSLDKRKTSQKDEALRIARQKMETQTIEAFLRYAKTPEVQAILNSNSKKSVQMAELRKLIFGK